MNLQTILLCNQNHMSMKTLLLITLFLLPCAIQAQVPLSLNDAIDIALQNNLELQIYRNYSEISRLNNNLGMAGGLPVVNVNAGNSNSQYDLNQKLVTGVEINKKDVTSHSVNSSLTASMVLFNGMKILATRDRLSVLQSQSEHELNRQIQSTIAAIMISYYDILRQLNYLEILKRSHDISSKEFEIVSERLRIGLANQADLLQVQMDLNLAGQNIISQKVIIEQEKINLLQLMGVREFYPLLLSDSILAGEYHEYTDTLLTALENNPSYLSASSQVKVNEQLIKEVRALRYPSLRLSAGYNYTYNSSSGGFNLFNQNYGPNINASLLIPVFNGNIYKTQQNVATLNFKNAELQKENILISIKAEFLKTLQTYQSTVEQIQSQEKNYTNARQLVDLVIQRFHLNQATILEVKAAQASFENAGYMLINLHFAAKLAEIELKLLSGSLGIR